MLRAAEHKPNRPIRDIVQRLQDRWRWKCFGITPPSTDVTAEWVEQGVMIGFVGGLRALGGRNVNGNHDRPGDSRS